ncbi:MAG: D-aminoacyl-tRNA deacylase [Eubacteriales bacterium]|nr:D-aminoacyl-tRNA deacylase [Eubacteriales bacterium]
MRCFVQRVKDASVTVDGTIIGQIHQGLLILLGVCNEDDTAVADKMIKKVLGARIFEDENGKTNRSLADVEGELLVVSQFTLYADCRKGNRPSFTRAGSAQHAEELYEYFLEQCRKSVPVVEHGEFGADMSVALINDGPFSIMYDSEELFPL